MEKKQLIKNGFKSWNRFNYRQFVRACANHGRDDVDSICKEMMLQGKKKEEVERYVNTKPKESEHRVYGKHCRLTFLFLLPSFKSVSLSLSRISSI